MAYTDKDLQSLDDAILKLQQGERVASVAYEGYSVQYAQVHLKDLLALRHHLKTELSSASKSRRIQVITSKGID